MSVNKALLYVIVIFFYNFSTAQQLINGEVKDVEGNVLEGVNITIQPINFGTTTDGYGKFKFQNVTKGTYKITLSHIGYKMITQEIVVSQKKLSLSFVLEDDLMNLQDVVVTGTFEPRIQLMSSTSVSVLKTNMLQQVYPQGTADLLQNIPGTFVDASAGEVFNKVYTRGISASAEDDMGWYYVSLQEDGLPVTLSQYAYYSPDLFHRIDLMTEKVEAIKGGSAAITAMNAPGGIYNFRSKITENELNGEVHLTNGFQGNNNFLHKIDFAIGSPIGKNWFINAGGHYRIDDGSRDTDFTFSKGGQFKFNVIKYHNQGHLKFYAKYLNDYTNRYTGVAAVNWDNPTPAFGQSFSSTSLLMPGFNASIPDRRNLNQNNFNSFNPSKGVHAKDFTLGVAISQHLGNHWLLRNNFKFSKKIANWQTSISNAFVSLNNPLAYFISGADFPIGQVVFKDAKSGLELARINNSGILVGESFQYLSGDSLPNDAIMGTSAWYIDNEANELINQFILEKDINNHSITTGMSMGFSDSSLFTQGSYGYATYEPNPRMLQVTLENPDAPIIMLSDTHGISNYGGLFYTNANAKVSQIATFINDHFKITDRLTVDLGLRYESIHHKGNKDRYAPFQQDGGLDGNTNTAYDNGMLTPTGEKDMFNFTYNYISYSAGSTYKLNNSSALFARFSHGNKAPELNYYFNNFSNVPILKKGAIQKIKQAELGVKYSGNNFSFTSTAFWSQLKDIGIANFEFEQESNTIFYTPIQLNTSTTVGLEWESIYTPIQHFTFRFNGVVQNAKATKWRIYDAGGTAITDDDQVMDYSGNTLPFTPNLMFNLGNEYHKNKISIFFNWHYMGKRDANVANGFKLPSYSTFSLGTKYLINKHLSANFIVTNLFNSKGLANFYGANSFGANANGATRTYIEANPDDSFIVFPVLQRKALLKLIYNF